MLKYLYTKSLGEILTKLFISIFLTLITISNLYALDREKSADIIRLLLPSIAYTTTFYIDDEEGRTQFYKSFFSTVTTTYLLKGVVKEERPNEDDNHSFPSGHTSLSFQSATFIHKRYGLKYALLPYLAASYVGYSRVDSEQHYIHDVIAGAIVGSGFSYYFSTPYKYKDIQIKPIVYSSADTKLNLYGLKVTW